MFDLFLLFICFPHLAILPGKVVPYVFSSFSHKRRLSNGWILTFKIMITKAHHGIREMILFSVREVLLGL